MYMMEIYRLVKNGNTGSAHGGYQSPDAVARPAAGNTGMISIAKQEIPKLPPNLGNARVLIQYYWFSEGRQSDYLEMSLGDFLSSYDSLKTTQLFLVTGWAIDGDGEWRNVQSLDILKTTLSDHTKSFIELLDRTIIDQYQTKNGYPPLYP